MAGTPADVARDTKRYEEAGLNHIVFDLRFRYADWYQQIDYVGSGSSAGGKSVKLVQIVQDVPNVQNVLRPSRF